MLQSWISHLAQLHRFENSLSQMWHSKSALSSHLSTEISGQIFMRDEEVDCCASQKTWPQVSHWELSTFESQAFTVGSECLKNLALSQLIHVLYCSMARQALSLTYDKAEVAGSLHCPRGWRDLPVSQSNSPQQFCPLVSAAIWIRRVEITDFVAFCSMELIRVTAITDFTQ